MDGIYRIVNENGTSPPCGDSELTTAALYDCIDGCPKCLHWARPLNVCAGGAGGVVMSYVCGCGHTWQTWWAEVAARAHAEAAREELGEAFAREVYP